mgnify:FL=1
MDSQIQTRIRQAVGTTRKVVPGYFEKTLAMRAELSGESSGSVYLGVTPSGLEEKILAAEWEPYSHPSVAPECVAFKAPLEGQIGMADLRCLPPDTTVTLDDRKQTANVSATIKGVRGTKARFSVLILGPEQGEEVVFTFHPGDPVVPSKVKVEPGMHGKTVTVAEALVMGLETAKIE